MGKYRNLLCWVTLIGLVGTFLLLYNCVDAAGHLKSGFLASGIIVGIFTSNFLRIILDLLLEEG